MVAILHGVGGTPEEVRWLISKYNLKRILKYTESDGKSELQIDYNEIESRKDRYGIFVLFTEHSRLSAEGVLAIYKSREIVEEGFRALKSDMRIDPVYHSKDVRIETHTVMVALGYLLMSVLRAILAREGIKHSFGGLSETIRSGNAVGGFYEHERLKNRTLSKKLSC
jgi:transposase